MAAGPRLDAAGTAKMKTIEEALNVLGRINGDVEQWALAAKRNQPTSTYPMKLRRALPQLATMLKGQFGIISDQILAINLASSRGAAEAPKIRTLREGVAHVRQALEIAQNRTKENHMTSGEKEDASNGASD
jgi:hypothetical protein